MGPSVSPLLAGKHWNICLADGGLEYFGAAVAHKTQEGEKTAGEEELHNAELITSVTSQPMLDVAVKTFWDTPVVKKYR